MARYSCGCNVGDTSRNSNHRDIIRRISRQSALWAQVQSNTMRIARLEGLVLPPGSDLPVRQFFLNNLGLSVTVTTLIGTVTGVVQTVGTDSVVLLEASGNTLIVPFRSVTTI